MNITIIGRLTKSIEMRIVSSGKSVANFSVAENHRKKDSSGNWQDVGATFWDCSVWEETAENLADDNWPKGTRVIVQGETYTERFTDKDGNDRTALKVKVIEVGKSRRGFKDTGQQGNGNGQQSRPQPSDDPYAAPYAAPAGAYSDEPPF